jgi:hypothetical protein
LPSIDSEQGRPVTVLREGMIRSSADAVRFVLEEEGHLS